MFAELVLEFEENGCHDVLGEMYMELEMYNKWIGQFFTPAHVASMIGKMVESSKDEIERQGFIKVCDPCCGAGVLLIEFASNCKDVNVNYQRDVLFIAQDIDPVVAKMCYIQMSLLGMPGYVKIGNTFIPQDTDEYWFTPMYLLSGFTWRRQKNFAAEAIESTIIEESTQILRETESGQFELVFD
jgi:type I restriction-modification system DNA methylase subunit